MITKKEIKRDKAQHSNNNPNALRWTTQMLIHDDSLIPQQSQQSSQPSSLMMICYGYIETQHSYWSYQWCPNYEIYQGRSQFHDKNKNDEDENNEQQQKLLYSNHDIV